MTDRELKVRGRPIFIPTSHVRKTGKCHRGAWKAGWQFPDVTRPELKVRGRPIFIPTLHVRKTDNGKTGREVPNRPLECATRDWESGKQNRKSTNKGARGLCANCWRVLSQIVLGQRYSDPSVAYSGGLCGTFRPVFPFSVFLTCNVRMKNGIPCTFSSGRVTSGNCQPALQATLWHFSVFLTCNVGMKNGLSRTFSSGRVTSGNPRPSFRVFWVASQSLFAASVFPDLSHQEIANVPSRPLCSTSGFPDVRKMPGNRKGPDAGRLVSVLLLKKEIFRRTGRQPKDCR